MPVVVEQHSVFLWEKEEKGGTSAEQDAGGAGSRLAAEQLSQRGPLLGEHDDN